METLRGDDGLSCCRRLSCCCCWMDDSSSSVVVVVASLDSDSVNEEGWGIM